MSWIVRARVERGTLVPENPLQIPEGAVLEIEIRLPEESISTGTWEERWQNFLARARRGLNISDESLQRESLCEDRQEVE